MKEESVPGGWKERLCSIQYLLYYTHAITSWGNRMWRFSVGLFLVQISKNLRLTAIYGFSTSASILLFGAMIGQWIDKNPRFKVAKLALFCQNGLLSLCATLFAIAFITSPTAMADRPGETSKLNLLNNANASSNLITSPSNITRVLRYNPVALQYCLMFLIILIALLADVAALVSRIVIDTDWVVVIANEKKLNLANLNAALKRIDLLSNILTPLLVGQILALVNFITGASFVAGWNIVSAFLEYALLRKIYTSVPRLAIKMDQTAEEQAGEMTAQNHEPVKELNGEIKEHKAQKDQMNSRSDEINDDLREKSGNLEEGNFNEKTPGLKIDDNENTTKESLEPLLSQHGQEKNKIAIKSIQSEIKSQQPMESNQAKLTFYKRLMKHYNTFVNGWKIYMGQKVKYAGVSYALLYLTVIGFDSITVGYAYTLKVSEAIIGTMIALGALTGIVGTFFYPRVRNRYGPIQTGIISLILQIACLGFCVASLWLPGSPWKPGYLIQDLRTSFSQKSQNVLSNGTKVHSKYEAVPETDFPGPDHELFTNYNPLNIPDHMASDTPSGNSSSRQPKFTNFSTTQKWNNSKIINELISTTPVTNKLNASSAGQPYYGNVSRPRMSRQINVTRKKIAANTTTFINKVEMKKKFINYAHIGLFLFGIVSSRIGLWMIDLTINQIMQESVVESQKGVINGVQRSITTLFEIVKYSAIILLPRPQTFGWLVLMSFASICASLACFLVYARQAKRSHLSLQQTTGEPNNTYSPAASTSAGGLFNNKSGEEQPSSSFLSNTSNILRRSRLSMRKLLLPQHPSKAAENDSSRNLSHSKRSHHLITSTPLTLKLAHRTNSLDTRGPVYDTEMTRPVQT